MALEKLLKDITEEKHLWTLENTDSKPEAQEAWTRVGKRNNLTALEARTTFKILLKRYKQEVLKPKSTWRLFDHFKSLKKEEEKKKMDIPMKVSPPLQDEETYVELLEVKDEDFSDDDSSSKENRANFNNSVSIKSDPETTQADVSSPTNADEKNSSNSILPNNKRKLCETEANDAENPAEKRQMTENNLTDERQAVDISNSTIEKSRGFDVANAALEMLNTIHSPIRSKAGTEYTSFGSYVASTLNKLPAREAAKLEVKLLQAIIDVKSDMLE